jgi:predicted glycoside hydrolase/deacetylase ChbG (UPF0249 family)
VSGETALPMAPSPTCSSAGLIVNGDDWGRDRLTTDRTLDCVRGGVISSVSAMVFMEDSERAADIARERGLDVGLHLNLTTPFSGRCGGSLAEPQRQLARFLRGHRFNRVVFHPGLRQAFADVVAAELDEFRRLYGQAPGRIDGHHHMHLCANVLFGRLLPCGTMVRRSFSFHVGEKSPGNVFYRWLVDRVLARRHRLVDYFFSLAPLAPSSRLQRIFDLARGYAVEVEAHPANAEEYRFLRDGELLARIGDVPIKSSSAVRVVKRGAL